MGFKLGKNKVKTNLEYAYQPRNKKELRDLVEQLLYRDHNANLNNIDVFEIEDMSYLFEDLYAYKIDISEWDVSNVIHMSGMFSGCTAFNCDLSKWNIKSARFIDGMFMGCKNFNSDLTNWDVSNVENMEQMFYNCYKFNGDLSNWDLRKCKTTEQMFFNCVAFTGKGLKTWKNFDVMDNMVEMFKYCSKFDCNLSKWTIKSNVIMDDMFYNTALTKYPKWYVEYYVE